MFNILPYPREVCYIGKDFKYSIPLRLNINQEIPQIDIPSYIKLVKSGGDLDLELVKESSIKNEGYRLTTNGKIVIEYGDKRGLKYGLDTLSQIVYEFYNHVIVPDVEILDYPSFNMRGVIEGFYDKPWSHGDRLNMISFLRKYKMNAYFYAPKDDPYHRERWMEPYPKEQFSKLNELIERCKYEDVDFIFSISPGGSIRFSSEEDFALLCEKIDCIAEKGVRKLALLLDDIDYTLKDEGDKELFKTPGEAQAFLCNKMYEHLKNKYGDIEFIMCPTEYWQSYDSVYRKNIREKLNKDIKVIWTGIGVFAPKISSRDAEKMSNIFGHKLLLWDNYPVNDYCRDNLLLGPIVSRTGVLYKYSPYIVSNPMNEAEASKITLLTYSEYMWNPEAYNPDVSINKAYSIMGKEGQKYLKQLCENAAAAKELDFKTPIEKMIEEYKENNDPDLLEQINQIFIDIKNLPDELEKHIENKKLLEDIKPWYRRISIDGEMGVLAVKVIKGEEDKKKLQNLISESKEVDKKYIGDLAIEFINDIAFN